MGQKVGQIQWWGSHNSASGNSFRMKLTKVIEQKLGNIIMKNAIWASDWFYQDLKYFALARSKQKECSIFCNTFKCAIFSICVTIKYSYRK